MLHVNL